MLLICTNTMHRLAEEVQAGVGIPLLHIADPTAGAILQRGLTRVGLLGTRFTMEGQFYRGRLAEKFHLQVVIPNEEEMTTIHTIIYDQLCAGEVREESRQAFLAIVHRMQRDDGIEGLVLGCTEIGLLIRPSDLPSLALFDSARLHAIAAVDMALGGGGK